jgi:hypothetical protein
LGCRQICADDVDSFRTQIKLFLELISYFSFYLFHYLLLSRFIGASVSPFALKSYRLISGARHLRALVSFFTFSWWHCAVDRLGGYHLGQFSSIYSLADAQDDMPTVQLF